MELLPCSVTQVDFVRNLAASYAFSCFGLNSLSVEDVTRVIQNSWGEDGGENILYVIPGDKEELGIELATCGWVVVVLSKLRIIYLNCHLVDPSLSYNLFSVEFTLG